MATTKKIYCAGIFVSMQKILAQNCGHKKPKSIWCFLADKGQVDALSPESRENIRKHLMLLKEKGWFARDEVKKSKLSGSIQQALHHFDMEMVIEQMQVAT